MNTTPCQKFVEDILSQDQFTLEELINAKHRHPIKHWLKLQWFLLTDAIELEIAKALGKTRITLTKLFSENDK